MSEPFLTRLRFMSFSKIPVHKTMEAKATKNLDTHSSYISCKLKWKILLPFVNHHAIVSFLLFCHHNDENFVLYFLYICNIFSNWITVGKTDFIQMQRFRGQQICLQLSSPKISFPFKSILTR